MSTRSVIVYTNDAGTARFYKHFDGYPTGVLPVILAGLRAGERNGELLRDEGLELELQTKEKLKEEDFGMQMDLEWIYLVDLKEKIIKIYGGGYSGQPAFKVVRRGVVDPMDEVERMMESARQREREDTQKFIGELLALGYTVNT
jgi:hypothetical protein